MDHSGNSGVPETAAEGDATHLLRGKHKPFLLLVLAVISTHTLYSAPLQYFNETKFVAVKVEQSLHNGSVVDNIARSNRQRSSRISYQLHRKNTFQNTYNPYLGCSPEVHQLHPEMASTLDFSSTISTDLKLLFMGDSVSIMNSQMFEEAAGASTDVDTNRTVLRYSWGTHEGLHVSAPISSRGGVIAGWRITALMQESMGQAKPPSNVKGGAWMRSDVETLLNHTYTVQDNSSNGATSTKKKRIGKFDALILRIPHGWMKLKEITRDRLEEAVRLTHEYFGVENVVVFTLPFVNNVRTREDLDDLRTTNKMIRDFSLLYTRRNTTQNGGVDNVVTLEFGHLMDAIIRWNAHLMGYNISTASASTEGASSIDNLLLEERCCSIKGVGLDSAIPQICSERVEIGSHACPKNGFARDGMHWCNENLNGRLVAGTACLLGCLYSKEDNDDLAMCMSDCNGRFMSLHPIDEFNGDIEE